MGPQLPIANNTGQFPEPDQQQQGAQQQQAQQQAPAPQQPSPQQMNTAHDTMMGRAFKVLSGQNTQYSIDPSTGQTVTSKVQNTPGQFFKNIVAAAILGGAAGAEGGTKTEGSGLAAAARGGQAVINYNQQQDQQRLGRAQQEYQNQQRAEEMQMKRDEAQRQAQGFQSEEQLRKAQIANANAETLKTNMLTQGANFTQHQDIAQNGQQHFKDYDAAGLQPKAQNISESDMQDFIKNHQGASTYDWEATGVKTTLDANGNPQYEYTYTAYDPKGQIPVSKGTLDQWKKDGMDKYYPDLFNTVKPGRALDAQQYIALKKIDAQLYNEQLIRSKNDQGSQAAVDKHKESMAAAARDYAEAKKANTENNIASLGATKDKQFAAALEELNKAGGDFSKISPSSRLLIGESTTKLLPSLESELKQQVSEGADQAAIDSTMKQMDQVRQLSLGALQPKGAGAGNAAQPGSPNFMVGNTPYAIPPDKIAGFLQTHPGATRVGPATVSKEPLTPQNVPEGLVILKGPQGQMEARPSENIGALKNDPKYAGFKVIGYGKMKSPTSAGTAAITYNPSF